MKKIKVTIITLILLTNSILLTAQGKNIPDYSFQKISPAVSNQSGFKISMLVGRNIFGVSASNSVMLKSNNLFNLEWMDNIQVLRPENKKVPSVYSLEQNYPNPFNPVTRIRYSVPKESYISLAVYNMLGEKVHQLIEGIMPPGTYTVDWNAGEFTSGIYLYNLKADNYTESKKLLLLK